MSRKLVIAIAAALALVSCGSPGNPLPPSLYLPQPVQDLAAARKGDTVTLSWTPPRMTADGVNLREGRLGATRICRGYDYPLTSCPEVVGTLDPSQTPIPRTTVNVPRLTWTQELAPETIRGCETGFATYALQVQNDLGRSAGLSNQVRVPLAPTLPPPANLSAQVTPEGVLLTFAGDLHHHEAPELSHVYRIARRAEAGGGNSVLTEIQLGREQRARFLDRTFEWEQTYTYTVTPITRVTREGKLIAEVEGDTSNPTKVFVHDAFAPAAPTGLQAVASGTGQTAFIDLTWDPGADEDLAGYNIYRVEPNGEVRRLNTQPAVAPSFRDERLERGRDYTYAVTAVDLRGNESSRSEPASETVPAQ